MFIAHNARGARAARPAAGSTQADKLTPGWLPRAASKGTAMPFSAASAARMPPLDFLLADPNEPPERIAPAPGREPALPAALARQRQCAVRGLLGAVVREPLGHA